MTYHTGIIIGRFQPFHLGHLYLFEKAFEKVDRVIVAVGSKDVGGKDNPYGFDKVKGMIRTVLENEDWQDRVIQILGVPDFPDDEVWRRYIEERVGPFDVVVSNNDWVTGIYKNSNKPVIEIPFYRRDIYEGKKIRKMMESGEKWEERLPEYIVNNISRSSTT